MNFPSFDSYMCIYCILLMLTTGTFSDYSAAFFNSSAFFFSSASLLKSAAVFNCAILSFSIAIGISYQSFTIRSISNGAWLPKFSFLLLVRMGTFNKIIYSIMMKFTNAAALDLLKLWPLVGSWVAARPALLQIMEDWFARVETTGGAVIISRGIIFIAARPFKRG
jgi:hypothetical protein